MRVGMDAWLPVDNINYFSVDRRMEIVLKNGTKIISDYFVSDYERIPLLDRIFSWPWRPFKTHRHSPRAYILSDNNIIVSLNTLCKIKEELKNEIT